MNRIRGPATSLATWLSRRRQKEQNSSRSIHILLEGSVRPATSYRVAPTADATHEKLAVVSVLPLPFHFATWPNGHNGRVRSMTPFVRCAASIRSGAEPVLIHS